VLSSASAAASVADDSDDPEIQFLKSLTPKQKKKLLKYVKFFCILAPTYEKLNKLLWTLLFYAVQ